MKNHASYRDLTRPIALTVLVGALAISPLPSAGARATAPREAAAPQRWSPTGEMLLARSAQTATLLDDGTVLVVGGWDQSVGPTPFTECERYDPATGAWAPTGSLRIGRVNHTATLLLDGRVLVVGGFQARGTAEIYDPTTGDWSDAASVAGHRQGHTATLLEDGKVLVAGGASRGTSQLFDPQAGAWSEPARMPYNTHYHTATLLSDGRVLVAGGATGNTLQTAVKLACLYDPPSATWSRIGRLEKARAFHSAVLLASGLVLVSGGANRARKPYRTCELFDPAAGAWQSTGQQSSPAGGAVSLADGTVLALGPPAQIYVPATGLWADSDAFPFDSNPEAPTRLADGRILVEGGHRTSAPFPAVALAALYTP